MKKVSFQTLDNRQIRIIISQETGNKLSKKLQLFRIAAWLQFTGSRALIKNPEEHYNLAGLNRKRLQPGKCKMTKICGPEYRKL